MTGTRNASRPSATHGTRHAGDGAPGFDRSRRGPMLPAATIIEGVAEVTERRLIEKSAAARAAAHPERIIEEPNWAAGESDARTRGFGRRTESYFADAGRFGRTSRSRTTLVSRRHEDESDLLWQALDLSRHARLRPSAEPVGLEAALRPIERSIGFRARRTAILAGGFLAGLLAIPVFLLSSSQAPIAAPIADVAIMGGGFGDLVLEDVSASFVPRGDGKVLSVEGTVRNGARKAAIVPPLRIALSDADSVVGERPLSIGLQRLEAGTSVHFVSHVAVSSETDGKMAIGFRANSQAPASGR